MNITNQGLFEAATEMMPDVFSSPSWKLSDQLFQARVFFRFVNPACHHHHAQQYGDRTTMKQLLLIGGWRFCKLKTMLRNNLRNFYVLHARLQKIKGATGGLTLW